MHFNPLRFLTVADTLPPGESRSNELDGIWFVGRGDEKEDSNMVPRFRTYALSPRHRPENLTLIMSDYSMSHNLAMRRIGSSYYALGGQGRIDPKNPDPGGDLRDGVRFVTGHARSECTEDVATRYSQNAQLLQRLSLDHIESSRAYDAAYLDGKRQALTALPAQLDAGADQRGLLIVHGSTIRRTIHAGRLELHLLLDRHVLRRRGHRVGICGWWGRASSESSADGIRAGRVHATPRCHGKNTPRCHGKNSD